MAAKAPNRVLFDSAHAPIPQQLDSYSILYKIALRTLVLFFYSKASLRGRRGFQETEATGSNGDSYPTEVGRQSLAQG